MHKEFWLGNHFESIHLESQEGSVRITRGVILTLKVLEQSGMHLLVERNAHE
jgi:hypothetical protein